MMYPIGFVHHNTVGSPWYEAISRSFYLKFTPGYVCPPSKIPFYPNVQYPVLKINIYVLFYSFLSVEIRLNLDPQVSELKSRIFTPENQIYSEIHVKHT